jgi:hypothetical protein
MKHSIFAHLKLIGLLFSLLFITNCGDKKVEPTFTSLQKNFFGGGANSCGKSTCHQTGTEAYAWIKFDMNTDAAGQYAALTSATNTNTGTPECNGIAVISSSGWDSSLIKALAGTQAERDEFKAAHGNCLPTRFSDMSVTVDDDTLAALKSWIASGAPNN